MERDMEKAVWRKMTGPALPCPWAAKKHSGNRLVKETDKNYRIDV
jgi:hypothetical protein